LDFGKKYSLGIFQTKEMTPVSIERSKHYE